jgi:hypothetical protein
MILENCCYDFFELLTLNMARQGFFGEIVHAEGAYIHDLLAGDFSKEKYYDFWRLRMDASRQGNLYPTHGLGPVSQVMNINRGDKMDYLAKQVGGHGGMDFLMDWHNIDCLRNGLPVDQDVYDAALWSSIFPLSEWSVKNRSNSIDVPDFTRGAWKTNTPVDITLSKGGNTVVKV